MPIYEYACEKCKSEFELEQRITDDPLKTCPRCRSRRVKRLISQTSFVLKGGGWYADAYASKPGESGKPEGAAESGGEDKSAETKPSDAKPSGKDPKSKTGKAKTAKAAA